MTTKIGILSDAHGNGAAFRQAVSVLRADGAERFVFLGDAVGYIPTLDVVRALMAMGGEVACILGNHERMLLKGESRTNEIYNLAPLDAVLAPDERAFLESWPTQRMQTLCGRRLLLVHGSPKDPTNGYVYPDTDLSEFTPAADYVFMGHTHHPFVRGQGDRVFVNVGSSGLPRDDGRFGSGAIFNGNSGEVSIIRFDITEATRETLAQAGEVHPAVRKVYERRRDQIVGEIR